MMTVLNDNHNRILKKSPELKVIISSATIDAETFQTFFNANVTSDKSKDTAVIMSLEGRMYPVDIHYLKEPISDYLQSAMDVAFAIHSQVGPYCLREQHDGLLCKLASQSLLIMAGDCRKVLVTFLYF